MSRAYIDAIRAGFEPNLEPGLRRIAEMMTRAAGDGDRHGEETSPH
jgi:hypothetical protein